MRRARMPMPMASVTASMTGLEDRRRDWQRQRHAIRTPGTAGVYDLRVNLGQNYSCTYNGATGWWGGTPSTSRTIAKLCVH